MIGTNKEMDPTTIITLDVVLARVTYMAPGFDSAAVCRCRQQVQATRPCGPTAAADAPVHVRIQEESVASQHTATRLPPSPTPALERPATELLVALAGVSFVAHMLVAGNYGYFRDELY